MRLYLINPSNPPVSIVKVKESRWNRFRVQLISLLGLIFLLVVFNRITRIDQVMLGAQRRW